MSYRCDGCGAEIRVAGGIANIWSTGGTSSTGMTLAFADGTEHLLCFDCIEALPADPTAGDVAALGEE